MSKEFNPVDISLDRTVNVELKPFIPPIKLDLESCDFSTALRRVLSPTMMDTTTTSDPEIPKFFEKRKRRLRITRKVKLRRSVKSADK